MNALMSFIFSLLVYVGGGCAVVHYTSGQWYELYAIVAWLGFWMAGLRAIALTTREIIIRLADEIRTATTAYLEEAKSEDEDDD
jgi:hypothetical protein